MTHYKKLSGAIALIVAIFGPLNPEALAQGDPESGKAIVYSCLGCHGIEGYRNAYPSYRVPKLGGQKAAYLVAALKSYRDGSRKHATMQAQASSLSDQEIEDVSAYLATLGNETVQEGGTRGASFEGAAACAACHGQNGIAVQPQWPTLAGQYEDYLVHSLKQYRSGERQNAMMMPMAANLSDEQIAQLAAYFSSLEGLETTAVDD